MKISVVIPPMEETVASNLYGMTDQHARPQLLPSDEELEELEKQEREGQKSTKAKETEKPDTDAEGDEKDSEGDEKDSEGDEKDSEGDEDADDEDDGMGDLDDEEDEDESADGDDEDADEESEDGDEEEEDEDEVAEASSYIIDRRPVTNSKLGVVISGFPGVGKSEFSRLALQNGISVSDSDSSKFNKIDFPSNYIEHIQRMRRERNIVLVSSHKSVRDAMDEVGIEYTLVVPEASLKPLYMKNYEQRGSDANFLNFMDREWDNMLETCVPTEGSTVIELPEGKYLSDIISDLV